MTNRRPDHTDREVPDSPAAPTDFLSPEAAQEERDIAHYGTIYNAIQVGTHGALPGLPLAEFVRKFSIICRTKNIDGASVHRKITKHIVEMKKLIDFQQRNNAPAPPLPPEEFFRVIHQVHFTEVNDEYLRGYLPLLDSSCQAFRDLTNEGLTFQNIEELGLLLLTASMILREGKGPEDPQCPFKLQITDIIFAQQSFDKGDIRTAIAQLYRYESGGLFPRDIDRLQTFANHTDPKYGALISYLLDLWEKSPGVPPQASIIPRGTIVPILLDQMSRPNTNFTAACRAFCEVATLENLDQFLRTIFPNAEACTSPVSLFALQNVVLGLDPNSRARLAYKFGCLPFFAEVDIAAMEKSLVRDTKLQLFFSLAIGNNELLVSLNTAKPGAPGAPAPTPPRSPETPEATESPEVVFARLHHTIQGNTNGEQPSLPEAEFVEKLSAHCLEKSIAPADLSGGILSLFIATNEHLCSLDALSVSGSFKGPKLVRRAKAKFEATGGKDFPEMLQNFEDIASALRYLRLLNEIDLVAAFKSWGLEMLVSPGGIGLSARPGVETPEASEFEPVMLALSQVYLENGDVEAAVRYIENYVFSLTAADYIHLQKFVQHAPPKYAFLISRLRFLAVHQGEGDIFGKKDDEAIGSLHDKIDRLISHKLQQSETTLEEARTLLASRIFSPLALDSELQLGFNVVIAEAYSSKEIDDLPGCYRRVKHRVLDVLLPVLMNRYFAHNEEINEQLIGEIYTAVDLSVSPFWKDGVMKEMADILLFLQEKFEALTGKNFKSTSPPRQGIYNKMAASVEVQLDFAVRWPPNSSSRNIRQAADKLFATSGGRIGTFSTAHVDDQQRVEMIKAAKGTIELVGYYNFATGKSRPEAGQFNSPLLVSRVVDQVKTFPGYLHELLASASFLKDGVITVISPKSVPLSLFSKIFTQAQPGDSCFRQLFDEFKSPNAETVYPACLLLASLISHDKNHQAIYLNMLGAEIFNTPASFSDPSKLLFLRYLFDACAPQGAQALVKKLASLPQIIGVDLTLMSKALIDGEKIVAQIDAARPKPVSPRSAPPGLNRTETPADLYAGTKFLAAYPDVGLIKDRDLEELAGEIIEKRSIDLPGQGAQLSTAFADSPLRELFPHVAVKADKAAVAGPKSLRVLVNLEGAEKLKLFCRVLDKGELQIRILKSGQDSELITAANAEKHGISAKVFTELNYFALEILRCIYVKTETEPAPTSDPPAATPPDAPEDSVEPTTDAPPAADEAAAEDPAPEAPLDPSVEPPTTPDPEPIIELEPQQVRPRHQGSMSIILGKRAAAEKAAQAKVERRAIAENLRLARQVFLPLFRGEEVPAPPQLEQVELYVAEYMAGKKGQPTEEIFYRKLPDPHAIYECLQDGTIHWSQICVRKARLHAQPLPYLVDIPKDPVVDGHAPLLHQIRKSSQTGIAAERYRLAVEDGQKEVDQKPVQSVLRMKVTDEPKARRLLEQVKDERASDRFRPMAGCPHPEDPRFIDKFIASRRREIEQNLEEQEVEYHQKRLEWEFLRQSFTDEASISDIKEVLSELESTYLEVRAALNASLQALEEGLSMVPEYAGIKDGLVALPQPGYFEFNQTFNQGSFITLETLLSQEETD